MSESHSLMILDDDSFDNSYLDGHFGGQFSDSALSMSAYEKPPTADLIDFHNENALQNGASFPYAQPQYASHIIYPSGLTNVQDPDFQYVAGPDFSSQYGFMGSRPAMIDARIRQAPEITSFTHEGSNGSIFTICIRTPHDLLSRPVVSFSVQFGSSDTRVATSLQPFGDMNGPLKQYTISGEVPSFITTHCYAFTVSMKLFIEIREEPSFSPLIMDIGNFTYVFQGGNASPPRKRKASDSSEYDLQPPSKKTAVRDHNSDSFERTSPYSSFLTTPTNGNTYNMNNLLTDSPRPHGHQYTASNASIISLTAPSPHTPGYSPSFSTVKTENSPQAPLTPIPRPASTASNVKPAGAPKLVRTSTMQTSPIGMSSSTHHPAATQSFNPYAMYPLKATLKLNGDLDAMVQDWAPEEFDARRRLVQFTRSQIQSTINADFKAISPEERPPNSITISCIYWKERKEYFVTSVDTIFLLEALVAVRFTVEEKNRIRRNLEGFRPLTVSKAKSDSEDFFKVIMGFPNPKPRNIEKDVKVFPWKILSLALKKIISKYSASYASTASVMPTPASSTYASTESSADCHCDNDLMESMPSYQMNSTAGYPGSMVQGSLSAPASTTSMADLRVQVPQQQQHIAPHMTPSYSMPMNYGYQPMPSQMTQAYHPQTPQVMSAPVVRMPQPWDFATFVNESPSSMAPASAPPSHYSREPLDTAAFVTPGNYSMNGR